MKQLCKTRALHKQAGLSLIELMISITLGLILMAGVVQMFVSSKSVFTWTA
jgi:type IV pilus assembly protein PilW